jgi:hypothetical protein
MKHLIIFIFLLTPATIFAQDHTDFLNQFLGEPKEMVLPLLGEEGVNYQKKGNQVFTMVDEYVQLSLKFKRGECILAYLATKNDMEYAGWVTATMPYYDAKQDTYLKNNTQFGFVKEDDMHIFYAKRNEDD